MKLKDIEAIWVQALVTFTPYQEENTFIDLEPVRVSLILISIKQPGFNCIGRRKKLSVKVLADSVKKAIKRLDPTTLRTDVTVVGLDVRTKSGKEVNTQVESSSGYSWRWDKGHDPYYRFALKASRTE